MFIHTWCNTMWPISIFWKIKKCPCVFCQGAILKVFITYHENKLPLSLFRLQCLQPRDLIISYIACQVLPTPHAPAVGPIQAKLLKFEPTLGSRSKCSFYRTARPAYQPFTYYYHQLSTLPNYVWYPYMVQYHVAPLGVFMNNSM